MTSTSKRPGSYVINGLLASSVLYWALDLSASGRTLIDWTVITLVIAAIAWNVFRLTQRVSRLGGKATWHVQRTVLFWIIGLMNTIFRSPSEPWSWKGTLGVALLVAAIADSVALYRMERKVTAEDPAATPNHG